MNSSLSIDIGGTKIRVMLYDRNYNVLRKIDLCTGDYFVKHKPNELAKILNEINRIVDQKKFDKVGFSIKGHIKNNILVYATLLGGRADINLCTLAKKYFLFNDFSADNDVICMAKAELKFGAGVSTNSFVLVNLGTGLRIVAVDNKQIIRGYSNVAGEVSLEKHWVPTLAANKSYMELLSGSGISSLTKTSGRSELCPEDFFKIGGPLLDLYLTALSDFLQTISSFYNPEKIVFCGSLTKSAKHWLNKTKKLYKNVALPFFLADELLISKVEYPASLGALL